jgi:hypothetical protein
MKGFRTDTSTTGKVVSTLGALLVRTNNLVTKNHEDPEAREALEREATAILLGQRGVPQEKVFARSVERCATARWN